MTRAFLVLLLVAGTAVAAPPRLTPYRGTNYTIDLPKGWSVKVDEAAGVLGAQQNPKNKASPTLMILTKVGVTGVSAETITSAIMQQLAGSSVKVVRDDEIENGRAIVADGKIDGIAVRIGLVVIVANGGAVVAALAAPKPKFQALGGTSLVISVLRSFRFTTTAAEKPAASPSAVADGVYVGTAPRTVTGRYGATMELALVWYTFGSGWFDWRWGPPHGLEIKRTDNALPYEVDGATFRYTSRGKQYTRKFTRLAKDRIKLDDITLTKVDLGYDGLTLAGTYHADSIARVTNPGATTTRGATTVASSQSMVLRKDGTVESERTTSADTPGVGGGQAEIRRRGRYAIRRNLITFTWSDGTSETRTFSTWGGANHLLIEKTLYSRKR